MKRKVIGKSMLGLCLLLSLFIQFFSVTTANAEILKKSKFQLKVSCDEESVDLSGIKVMIYSACLSYEDSLNGYRMFEEAYVESVYTDANGIIRFNRPSECFSISIDLESLPEKMGIDVQTKFYTADVMYDVINLRCIDNIEVNEVYGEISINYYSKDDKILFAKQVYDLSELTEYKNYEISDLVDEKQIIKEERVCINGIEYEIADMIDISGKNIIEKIDALYDNQMINELERAELYTKYLNNPQIHVDINTDYVDGTKLYWDIRNVLQEQTKSVESVSVNSNYINQASVVSSSGRFKVYYESGTTNPMSRNVALAVANEFDAVYSLFVGNYNFRAPYTPSSNEYCIYLLYEPGYNGSTPLSGTDGSYINIDYDIANSNQRQRTVAHEYMHAIQYRYGIMYDNNDRFWMHEAFASWAGLIYRGESDNWFEYYANVFLEDTWLPLNDITSNRHYGAFLFPLFISQNMGGISTIRKIFENYTGNPFDAIDVGVFSVNSEYTLEKVLAGFASYNYDPAQFYAPYGTLGWGTGDVVSVDTYPNVSPVTLGVNKMACHYTEFIAPLDNSTHTLTITIDYSSVTGGAVNMLKTIRTVGNGTNYISDRVINGSRITIQQFNFGDNIAKAITIVPINAGTTSGYVNYTRTTVLN